MHPLLKRQQQHYLASAKVEDLEPFLQAVDAAYYAFDKDKRLIEHSMDLMSTELNQRNREMRQELVSRKGVEEALRQSYENLKEINARLESAQNQLLQADKMASIGQLAAGVAHEINNPIGYISSNLNTLERYVNDLLRLLEGYEKYFETHGKHLVADEDLRAIEKKVDIRYLREDLPELLNESKEGIDRVKKIVQDLKDFSHVDEAEWQWTDLHKGLDSTLNIVRNEIKTKAEVVRNYGALPDIQCLASQLNQVFLNILVNASHAIETSGMITVSTGKEGDEVWVKISDTGKGIAKEDMSRIFDAFFTTKPVGQGTGLGLSLSYSIIKKHQGRIEVDSVVGKGTQFTIWLPISQPIDTTSETNNNLK